MGQLQRTHPLDRLMDDDSLFFLEAMIPFVDNKLKKMLVILIKVKELSAIMNSLSNPSYLTECGFNCHPKNADEFISGMCNFMPESFRNSINQMQQMMNMMKIMNAMEETKNNNESDVNNLFSNDSFSDNIHNENNNSQTNDSYDSGSLFDNIMSIIDNKG